MKRSLYLESTIPSYLVAAPSRDLLIAAHQQVTMEWWKTRRVGFDLYVSQFVLDEIGRGNAEVARRRVDAVKGIPLLDIGEDILDLAAGFLALRIDHRPQLRRRGPASPAGRPEHRPASRYRLLSGGTPPARSARSWTAHPEQCTNPQRSAQDRRWQEGREGAARITSSGPR